MSCNPTNSSDFDQSEKSTQGTAITMGENTLHTIGVLPEVGSQAPSFELTGNELNQVSLHDFEGKNVVLNVFPSIDTKTCAQSVRTFNERAANLENTVVLCISKDLPFAQSRFCGAEGIDNVITLSDFRSDFGKKYGVELVDGPVQGLLSRAVLVIDPNGKIIYTEQVPVLSDEPDYDQAIEALNS